ncbi:MAG: DNA repair protein RecN [Methylothermaceae bacterium]|nr:DNA repair protein RecN [Methylothermaceae bacterium]
MLTALSIHNFAVVKRLNLDWCPGFTALTGETGAGKSILLTALDLGLGGRAAADLVRSGADKAEIVLEFDLEQAPTARQWLVDNDLGDGPDCLIRRSVAAKKRNRAFINDRPVGLEALQNLGQHLVEIHGQHAHLRLRQPSAQRQLLDAHAGNDSLLTELTGLYRDWRATREHLMRLRQDVGDRSLREEFLRFQIQELEAAAIEDLDFDALIEEHTRLSNLDKILASAQSQLHLLYEDDASVSDRIDQAARELESLLELAPEFQETAELVRSAQIQLEEAGHLLRQRLEDLESDPDRLMRLEEQLTGLHDLARKHRLAPEALPERLVEMRAELDGLTHQEIRITESEQRLEALEAAYREQASRLSARRCDCAEGLAARITELIRELGMPHGQFAIDLQTETASDPRPEGLDRVEFRVATNPGMPPKPLAKVASGGELSRLSLAIQVACSEARSVPTLIFDEVDTGIGGGVAEIVGRRLRELGGNRQVLCVTHLPQVAAQAHHHYLVSKAQPEPAADSDHVGVETRVHPLDSDRRQQEIARMLGGLTITDQTLAHAEEMLQWTR